LGLFQNEATMLIVTRLGSCGLFLKPKESKQVKNQGKNKNKKRPVKNGCKFKS
jgi:hypothetical protein